MRRAELKILFADFVYVCLRGEKAGEMGKRMRMGMKVGDVCCEGVGMEIGLRRVVIVSLLAVGSSREEEAEFRSFL